MTPGFTLIELLVVICIVAITTALVLPRVWQWQREARIGNLLGTRGAVHSAAMIVHAAALSRSGSPDAAPCAGGGGTADNRLEGRGSVCTEHGLVRTQHGYPASVSADESGPPGILGAAGLGTVFGARAQQLRDEGYAVTVAQGTTTIARADAPDPAHCSFTYTEPAAARAAATISPGVVSGC